MTESNQGTADMQEITDAITQLGVLINAHGPRLTLVEQALQQLTTTVQALCARPPPAPPATQPSSGAGSSTSAAPSVPPASLKVTLSAPQPFSGGPNACRGFVLQCSQVFLH